MISVKVLFIKKCFKIDKIGKKEKYGRFSINDPSYARNISFGQLQDHMDNLLVEQV